MAHKQWEAWGSKGVALRACPLPWGRRRIVALQAWPPKLAQRLLSAFAPGEAKVVLLQAQATLSLRMIAGLGGGST